MPLSFVLFAGLVGLVAGGWITGRLVALAQRRRRIAAGQAELPVARVESR